MIAAALTMIMGCGDKSPPLGGDSSGDLVSQRIEFGNKWKVASLEARRKMADVGTIYKLFKGVYKEQVVKSLGDPTEMGVDELGEDFMRYELGAQKGDDEQPLRFVFENNALIRVERSFVTL